MAVFFTASVEPIEQKILTPHYVDLVKQITPGKMLVLQFPKGTTAAEIHLVRVDLLSASSRWQGTGKLKTYTKDNTLYVYLAGEWMTVPTHNTSIEETSCQ